MNVTGERIPLVSLLLLGGIKVGLGSIFRKASQINHLKFFHEFPQIFCILGVWCIMDSVVMAVVIGTVGTNPEGEG